MTNDPLFLPDFLLDGMLPLGCSKVEDSATRNPTNRNASTIHRFRTAINRQRSWRVSILPLSISFPIDNRVYTRIDIAVPASSVVSPRPVRNFRDKYHWCIYLRLLQCFVVSRPLGAHLQRSSSHEVGCYPLHDLHNLISSPEWLQKQTGV